MSALALTVDELRLIEPRFERLDEIPIRVPNAPAILGWHSSAMGGTADLVLGSGSGKTREEARRVALAETLERACIVKLRNSKESEAFGFNAYPTSCGFAAGFEFDSTRFRSLCEAVERWARALWIDEHYLLTSLNGDALPRSPLMRHFLAPFARTLFFSKVFTVRDPLHKKYISLKLGMVVGFTNNGAFPGSRVCSEGETPWDHACLEAWRHHAIVQNGGLSNLPEDSYLQRISHFSTRGDEALGQIERAHRYDWPQADIVIHRCYEAIPKKLYVWRSLCDGYQGWDQGDVNRFVY